MRQRWIVSYDIADPKRLRRVYRTLLGYGDWLQLSVFRCDLTRRERVRLQADLEECIQPTADQVCFFDLGPADGRGESAVQSVGRPVEAPRRVVVL